MILVDTSVWIDHFHRSEPRLGRALEDDMVATHPFVIQELALGSLQSRDVILSALDALYAFPMLAVHELLTLVRRNRLWGRGLSAVDAHVLGSLVLEPGSVLWTRDKRMLAAARDLGIGVLEEGT